VILADALQRVADGDLSRLMVFMPPRHGKSELVSRLFPAYYLYRHPERWAAISSYAADLAYTLSRNARENYTRSGGTLSGDASAVKHWETGAGGGLWATGVGGPATGKGFHLGITDDPIKNHEEADSEVIRSRHRDWWDSTWYTRSEPDASLVMVQTRWNEDDLSGYLLEKESQDPECWHIINFPAISEPEAERQTFPESCTVEPEFREPDEALCPPRYSLARLKQIAKKIGDYFFDALFQQRPRPKAGDFFKREWFVRTVDEVPRQAFRIRYWDRAGTEGGGAFTVGALLALDPQGIIYIEDIVRGQWSQYERDTMILATAEADAREYGRGSVEIWQEQEGGSGGKEAAMGFVKILKGYPAHVEVSTGSKETRARPFASYAEAGNVRLKKADWNKAYVSELVGFPMGGKYKDQVDATSGAFAKLTLRKRAKVNY
jgi:predicted phage terminase large subunit-like protein